MGWVKLDDDWATHPKMLAAGLDGRAFWLEGLCYCSRYLTDGSIPVSVLPLVAVHAGVSSEQAQALAARLVELELWSSDGKSYRVDNYLRWQRSKEQVEHEREKTRERAERSRARQQQPSRPSNAVTRAVTSPATHAVINGVSNPPTEAEAEADTENPSLARRKQSYPQASNSIADALLDACGIEGKGVTSSQAKDLGAAVAELKRVGATPGDVADRARVYRTKYPNAALTPRALSKHWGALQAPATVEEPEPATPATCRWCHAYLTKHHTEDECSRRPYEEAQ